MNAAAGPRLILKENEESCFGVAIWDSRRDAGEPEVSKQHVKPSTGSCEQFLFSPLLQAMQKKKKRVSHRPAHMLAFLCAFWLSFLHTCHRMAQRGLCSGRPGQLEEALTGPVSMQMVLGDKSPGLQDADGGPAGRSSLDTHQETQRDSKGWDPGGSSAWESPISSWRA